VKAVVITGGAGGLGSALAMELGARGYRVLALYGSDRVAADALAERLRMAGVEGEVVRQDITSADVTDCLARFDWVTGAAELVLVNNACAPFTPKPFHLHDWTEVAAALDVAVKGSFLCTKALLRPLAARRGTVVNVLSRAVTGDVPKGFGAYVIAKSALLGMTRALAAEYGERLRVFSVSPGFMRTPLTAAWDARLTDAMAGGDVRGVDAVARVIADLISAAATPARGEDYPL